MSRTHLKQILIIILAGTLFGLGWNIGMIKRYVQGEFELGFLTEKESSAVIFITLPEAEGLFAAREAEFIDSRSRSSFKQGHIPGALNIPFEEFHDIPDDLLESFPPDRILVIYCDGQECQSSIKLARHLFQQGFRDIRVFFGGWEEWRKEGLPIGYEDDTR